MSDPKLCLIFVSGSSVIPYRKNLIEKISKPVKFWNHNLVQPFFDSKVTGLLMEPPKKGSAERDVPEHEDVRGWQI